MDAKLIRSHPDQVTDSFFGRAMHGWDGSATASDLLDAIRPHCDAATNLYYIDVSPTNLLGCRLKTISQSFSLAHAPSFEFGDYPDRRYMEDAVVPCMADMLNSGSPALHKIHTRVQNKYAVYERLALPVFGLHGVAASVSVSRLVMLVDPFPETPPEALSEREGQCLDLLAQGLSAKRIAARLEIAQTTVENCIGRLKAKLDAQSTAHAVAIAILTRAVGPAPRPRIIRSPAPTGPSLSGRERQCLGFLASGLSIRSIAYELELSAKTVEEHVASMKRKLRARNIAEAMALGVVQAYGIGGQKTSRAA
jgi:DNA-binding CsgD family transcriptional regulator